MLLWLFLLISSCVAQTLFHYASHVYNPTWISPITNFKFDVDSRNPPYWTNPVVITGSGSTSGSVSEVMVQTTRAGAKPGGKFQYTFNLSQGAPDGASVGSSYAYTFVAEAGVYSDDDQLTKFELRNTMISDFIPNSWTQITFTTPFTAAANPIVIAKVSNYSSTANRPYLITRVTNVTKTGFMLGIQTQSNNVAAFGPPVQVSWLAGNVGCWKIDGDPIALNTALVRTNGLGFVILCSNYFVFNPYWVVGATSFLNPQSYALQWDTPNLGIRSDGLPEANLHFVSDTLTANNAPTQDENVGYMAFTNLGLYWSTLSTTDTSFSTPNDNYQYGRFVYNSSFGSSFAFVVSTPENQNSTVVSINYRAGTYPGDLVYDGKADSFITPGVYQLNVSNPINGRQYWLGIKRTGTLSYNVFARALYLLPVISSFAPSTSPTSGGARLVITGNFFSSDSLVFIGNYSCGNVSISGVVQIACDIPPGVGKNLQVTLKALLTRSSGPQYTIAPTNFSYDGPSVTSTNPLTVPTTGGNVTLIGSNFGTLSAASVTVTATGAPLSVYSVGQSGNQQTMLVSIPVGQDVIGITVTVGGQSTDTLLSYTAPKITSVTPQKMDTSGQVLVTIIGTNFGLDATATIDDNPCPRFTQNHTAFVCYLPPGQGRQQSTTIKVGQQSYTALQSYSYAEPNITKLDPNHGPAAGGYNLTIVGTSFGISGATVPFGSTFCDLLAQNHTSVICRVPSGAGVAQVNVVVEDQYASPVSFNYDAPIINNLSSAPGDGVTQGGGNLTITGINFGSVTITATVKVNFAPCPLLFHNDTLIICKLPPGQGTTNEVQLQVGGQVSSLNDNNTIYDYFQTSPTSYSTTLTTTTVVVNETTTVTTISTLTTIVTTRQY